MKIIIMLYLSVKFKFFFIYIFIYNCLLGFMFVKNVFYEDWLFWMVFINKLLWMGNDILFF